MIRGIQEKINRGFEGVWGSPRDMWNDVFLILAFILVALGAFGLGRLSITLGESDALRIVYPEVGEVRGVQAIQEEKYVASRSGSKYHLVSCPGAQSIKSENKIFFASKTEAEAAGYTPAANCKGI